MSVYTLDDPGTTCGFDSRDCTSWASGHGGFDQHHPFPLSMGGSDTEQLLALCPTHHRRQHALIRYLVELDGADPDWAVLEHFTSIERDTAEHAVARWVAAGRPDIGGWPCPAARAV